MFINAKSILFLLLLTIITAQIIEEDPETQSLIKTRIDDSNDKENCTCLNNGQCYVSLSSNLTSDHQKEVYCRCSSYYIGKRCQIEAYEVSTTKEISEKINIHEYKYFYYEPMEQNMYSFSFDLCFDNKNTLKSIGQKSLTDQITFFLTTENEDGGFQINEEITKATTISFDQDECKTITIDYTVLLITKVKNIQKLIFAVKLGQKLGPDSIKNEKDKEKQMEKEKEKQKENIKQVEKQIKKETQNQNDNIKKNSLDSTDKTVSSDISTNPVKSPKIVIDYHPISYTVYSQKKKSSLLKDDDTAKKQSLKEFKSKSPSKLKQNDDLYLSKTIYINFTVYPFMVEFVVFNILFSLTTLVAFIIVGIMIFIIRSRILGIRITRSLGISSRLINDLRHFDRFIPSQKYIKKEKKQGDTSPNSSQIQCAICLVKFQDMEQIRRTPCSHVFHKNCIDSWCHQNLTCPMCRKSLTQKNMADFYNSTALQLKNSPESDD